jgi:hypothetical protein
MQIIEVLQFFSVISMHCCALKKAWGLLVDIRNIIFIYVHSFKVPGMKGNMQCVSVNGKHLLYVHVNMFILYMYE